MYKKSLVFFGLTILFISACSDGDTDKDDSSNNTDETAIVYTGTQNLILSAEGESQTTEIQATIRVNVEQITIEPLSASGSIAEGNFVAISNRQSSHDGLTCQFLLTYRGTVNDSSVSGSITGSAVCDGDDEGVTQEVIGTVTASRSN